MTTNINKINKIGIDDDCKEVVMCSKSSQNESNNCFTVDKVNQRTQIDVIDMQDYKTQKYKYFFVYEDQFSKYIVLKALEKNCFDEVAEKLIDIFMIIGVPQVIQSNNDVNYAKNLVQRIKLHVPGVNIIYDNLMKDNHIDRDFKSLVKSWQIKNPTRQWHESLKYIQILENIAINVHNKKSPAAFILDNKILADVKRVIENSDIHNELYLETNQQTNEIIPTKNNNLDNKQECKTINKNVNNNQAAVKINEKSPMSKLKIDEQMERIEIEEILEIEIVEENGISSEHKFIKGLTSLKCNVCSASFQQIDLYKKHILECCDETTTNPIESHTDDNKSEKRTETNAESDITLRPNTRSKKLKNSDTTSQSNIKIENQSNKSVKHLSNGNSKKLLNSKRKFRPRKKKSTGVSTKMTNNQSLECEYCKQRFDFPSILKRHMRTHTNERPYVCQICSKSFKQLGHLSQHLLTHADNRLFQCTTCGITCESLDTLKDHSKTHKDITNSSNRLVANDTSYRLYECDHCKKVFTSKSVLERHIYTHTHERHFACEMCGKRFKQAGHVKSHMLTHTGERKFSCLICQKRFGLSNALKKHMYTHNGNKPYQCDICGARFLEKRNLNGHVMTHTNERPFGCKICGKRYTLADTLKRHVSASHEDGRTYQCEICAKMFKQLAHLSVHKKIHTDERPFQCHLCAKNFKHKNVLNSHLAIHANIRRFECDICKGTFIRKTNLQSHIAAAHMNERPYSCPVCEKRFKQISHLNGHIVVHSNSLPYQCEFCERRCNRLDNLKKHMKLHTRTKDKKM